MCTWCVGVLGIVTESRESGEQPSVNSSSQLRQGRTDTRDFTNWGLKKL